MIHHSIGRIAAAMTLGLLLGLVALELVGAGLFYVKNHQLVYANAVPPAAALPAGEKSYKQRLHPYFGFTGPYSETYEPSFGAIYTNSLGFLQREPLVLPVPRRAGDFVVAVFGGSVASNLVIAPQGGLQLRPALQKLPALERKRVVVIDMAQGSGKQPQQLMELAFLLALGQSFDLAVDVDGFNELALGLESYRAGIAPILPASSIMGGLAQEVLPATSGSVEYYEIAYEVSAAKRSAARHAAAAQTARSGIQFLMQRALLALDQRTLQKVLPRYNDALSGAGDRRTREHVLGLDMPVDRSNPEAVRELYHVWMRSSRQMEMIARANGIGYLQIVQPNQYYSKKVFSPQESEIALSLPSDHPHRVAVAEGYRMLESQMAAQAEPWLISAIRLFDAVRDDTYVDNCCHYNERGETMFAEFVAARVADWLAARATDRR
jgi:hypothetical protein